MHEGRMLDIFTKNHYLVFSLSLSLTHTHWLQSVVLSCSGYLMLLVSLSRHLAFYCELLWKVSIIYILPRGWKTLKFKAFDHKVGCTHWVEGKVVGSRPTGHMCNYQLKKGK
jgi:hypothetical protein